MAFADIGTVGKGRINWDAPVFQKVGAKHLPWFMILDEHGKITASDDETRKAYNLPTD